MKDTALLVIDIQRGAFDAQRCPPIDRAAELVERANALIDAARASGTPIVFVQHASEPGDPFEAGSVHAELHDSFGPRPDERVVQKWESSAFDGTDLQAHLQGLGVKQVVVCGLQSEFCVSNTSRSALALGYLVQLAADGHSTWPSDGRTSQAISDAVNQALQAAGAVLQPTAALAAAIEGRP
jgi:nicotinamidase-related amidase